jgi:hypothetical protein
MGAVCACVVSLFSLPTYATAVSGQGTWETTLQGRDLDGNLSTAEAYYDTVLGITWLADANYAQTSGYDPDGLMTWDTAANLVTGWAATLNPYGSGITGWRLPTVSPVDGTTADDANTSNIGTEDRGYNISAPGTLYAGSTASEMAHLFYNTLGDKGFCDPTTSTDSSCSGPQAGYGLSNTGPFSNVQSNAYWSATDYAPNSTLVFDFLFDIGNQNINFKVNDHYAWAVHAGDVGASVVPVPAAAWLFGSGLIGLVGLGRQRRH